MRVLLYACTPSPVQANNNLNSAAHDSLFCHYFARDDIEDNSEGEDGDEEGDHDAGANTKENRDNGITQTSPRLNQNAMRRSES